MKLIVRIIVMPILVFISDVKCRETVLPLDSFETSTSRPNPKRRAQRAPILGYSIYYAKSDQVQNGNVCGENVYLWVSHNPVQRGGVLGYRHFGIY